MKREEVREYRETGEWSKREPFVLTTEGKVGSVITQFYFGVRRA